MTKPITRPVHGLIDYLYSTAIAAAPEAFEFKDEETAALLCRGVAGAAAVTSLFTRYERGVIKIIPFKVHLAGDVLSTILLYAAPFVFKFSHNARARNTFLAFAVIETVALLLSQTDEMPDYKL